LFTGTRGVGKTSVARLLSLTINCLNNTDGNPCYKCDSCKDILTGNSLDVREIDGASNNKVDDVRELRETIDYLPTFGKYKIVIIDEVHMLTTSAFNALLKTLEEPPEHLIFIFATTEAHKIPDTILSRCQRYDFKRISESEIVDRFRYILKEENFEADTEALFMIAKKANGSMRDGVSLLDQIISFSDKHISTQIVESFLGIIGDDVFIKMFLYIIKKDFDGIIGLIDYIYNNGHDFGDVLDHFITFTRNSLLAKKAPNYWLKTKEYNKKTKDIILETAENLKDRDLIRILSILDKTNQDLRHTKDDKMAFEIALYKITQLFNGVSLSSSLKNYEIKNPENIGSMENLNKEKQVKLETLEINKNLKLKTVEDDKKEKIAEETVKNSKNTNDIEIQPIDNPKTEVKTMSFIQEENDQKETILSPSEALTILKKNEPNIFDNITFRADDNSEHKLICSIMVTNQFHKKTYEEIEEKIMVKIKNLTNKDVIFEYIISDDAIFIQADKNDPETILEKEIVENPLLGKFIKELNLTITKIKSTDKKEQI